MNAIAANGKLLTPEQSARLAILDSVDRDQLIEHIVRGLQSSEMRKDRQSRTFRDRWNRGKTKQRRNRRAP